MQKTYIKSDILVNKAVCTHFNLIFMKHIEIPANCYITSS